MSGVRRPWWRALPLFQALASAVALAALVLGMRAQGGAVELAALDGPSLGLAVLIKVLSLSVHELRLLLALPRPRPPTAMVFAAGFTAGMINLALPARAGDAALVGMLARLPGQRWEGALAAVGRVGAIEVVAFALACSAALAAALAYDLPWLSLTSARTAAGSLGLGLLFAALAVGAVLRLQRRRATAATESPPGRGFARIGAALLSAASPRGLAIDLGLALLEIATMVGAFAVGLSAAGVEVAAVMPTATAILALSATASLVLPPGYGAGPTAAAAAVLGAAGVPAEGILRYALCWWLISQAPAVLAGALSLAWTHRLARSAPENNA